MAGEHESTLPIAGDQPASGVADSTASMQAGRELDALIAEKVFGYKLIRSRDLWIKNETGFLERATCGRVPKYSTEIAAAWQVYIACVENFGAVSIYADMEEWDETHPVCIYIDGGAEVLWKPFPLAICIATLAYLNAVSKRLKRAREAE